MTLDARSALPPDADERTTLVTFLDHQPEAARADARRARRRRAAPAPVAQLALSRMGLVRHLAGVERWYFAVVLGGDDASTGLFDPHEDLDDVATATGAATFDLWRREIDGARRVSAELGPDSRARFPSTVRPFPDCGSRCAGC